MRILYYNWNSVYNEMMIERFTSREDVELSVFEKVPSDFTVDAEFSLEMMKVINEKSIEMVFSFDYYPIISLICNVVKIPYVSWIVDCPMLTLQSKTISNECNYVFNFDRIYTDRIAALGCPHSIHMPLGGYERMLENAVGRDDVKTSRDINGKYACDISFVGSLYTDKKNRYRTAKLDDYTKGFADGLIDSQEKIYGFNLLKESLSEKVTDSYSKACQLELGDLFFEDKAQLVADSLSVETTAREREHVLGMLSEYWDVDLYTNCQIPGKLKKPKLHSKGTVKYDTQMPLVFRDSRINLNITSKSIESGVPLRIFDILACGGFCMTNYQTEVAELFEDGVDLVMYSSLEDLREKVYYYLNHEEERAAIAANGRAKLIERYTLGQALDRMLSYF